jgi:diaminopimelate epimerase
MLPVRISKMHGTLNDFVVIDRRREQVDDLATFAKWVCERRSGVGADGLLVIENSAIADVRMRIINADGGEAEMCGNGMRCIARYLAEAGEGENLAVETASGTIRTRVLAREPEFLVSVELGTPIVERRALPFEYARFVSLGNPHVIIFERQVKRFDLTDAAAQAQQHFPEGINVHVAAVIDGVLYVRHWERGVGLTMACGTGAASAAAAAITERMVTSPVDVRVPGGHLRVDWDGRGHAFLTGPAVRVFDGELCADVVRV